MEQERGTWKDNLRQEWAPWLDELTYGIEVKPGWQVLIEETMQEIAHAVGGPQTCSKLKITRLREKFGGLTCQISGVPDDRRSAVDAILREAMEKSLRTCEWCGRPGRQRDADVVQDYWTVECDEHARQRGGRGR